MAPPDITPQNPASPAREAERAEQSAAVDGRMTTLLPAPGAAPASPGGPLTEDDRYEELSLLGIGGCGRVTRTYDRRLRRIVAHKRLSDGCDEYRALLVQEARLLAYLDHPGVVQVFDSSPDAYTMKLIEGETLEQRRARGPVPIGEAVRILARIAETMASAHAKGVMHLDLKPANIILQPYGQVSIIDWGLARFHDIEAYAAYLRAAGETATPQASAWEGFAGTPSYMPAEQARGEALTPAADVFACGTILYELITGELPFEGGPMVRGVLAKAEVTPARPSELRADVPARLDALCMRMLGATAESRPGSFTEVLAELEALAGGREDGEIVELAAGETLFREGEAGTSAYQILSGVVRVTVDGPTGPTELARRSVGDVIGELSIVSRAPRSATVTAVEATRLAVITPDRIERELDTANPLLARIVRSLSDRLRQAAEGARG